MYICLYICIVIYGLLSVIIWTVPKILNAILVFFIISVAVYKTNVSYR